MDSDSDSEFEDIVMNNLAKRFPKSFTGPTSQTDEVGYLVIII